MTICNSRCSANLIYQFTKIPIYKCHICMHKIELLVPMLPVNFGSRNYEIFERLFIYLESICYRAHR